MPNEPIRLPNEVTSKPILDSRTIWGNVALAVAIVVAKRFGYELSTEEQTVIVLLANIGLRIITTRPVTVKIGGGA